MFLMMTMRKPAKRSLKRSSKSPALSKNHLRRNSSSPRAEAAERKLPQLLQQRSLPPRSKRPQKMVKSLRMQHRRRRVRQARVAVVVGHARLSMKKWSVKVKFQMKRRMLRTLTRKSKRYQPSPKMAKLAKPQRPSNNNSSNNSNSSKKRTMTRASSRGRSTATSARMAVMSCAVRAARRSPITSALA